MTERLSLLGIFSLIIVITYAAFLGNMLPMVLLGLILWSIGISFIIAVIVLILND